MASSFLSGQFFESIIKDRWLDPPVGATTTKMILRGTAQTLIETVPKSNHLRKYLTINGGSCFIYRGTKKWPSRKSIYGGGHFINRGSWKMPAYKNIFTKAVVLRHPPPKIFYFRRRLAKDARLHKTNSGGGYTIMPASKKAKAQLAQASPTIFDYKYKET